MACTVDCGMSERPGPIEGQGRECFHVPASGRRRQMRRGCGGGRKACLVGDEVDVCEDEVVCPAVVHRHVAQRVDGVQALHSRPRASPLVSRPRQRPPPLARPLAWEAPTRWKSTRSRSCAISRKSASRFCVRSTARRTLSRRQGRCMCSLQEAEALDAPCLFQPPRPTHLAVKCCRDRAVPSFEHAHEDR